MARGPTLYVMPDHEPVLVPLPPRGFTGSRRGHVWVPTAFARLRCEGLDPRLSPSPFTSGHADIERGDRYLRKLWRVGGQKPAWYITSLHCEACARTIEAELGIEAEGERDAARALRRAGGR